MNEPLYAGTGRQEVTLRKDGVAVHDPLYVKALFLKKGECAVLIMTLDAVAIGGIADVRDDFLPRLRQRLHAEIGLPPEHLLLNASHTHPTNELLCDDAQLLERSLDAVRTAYAALEPVRIGAGKGHEDRIIINRALPMKDGSLWTIRLSTPSPPDDEVAGVNAIDPEIGILRIDRLDGTPLALVYNYACHTLIGVPSGAITANFPGFASALIEEHLPGVTAFFLQGAAGDVTELLYKDVNRPRDARPLGEMLGLSILKAWRQIATGEAAELGVFNDEVLLPRRTDSAQRIAELEAERDRLVASLRFSSLNFKQFLPLYLKHLIDPSAPADYSYRYHQEAMLGVDDLRLMDETNRRSLKRYLENLQATERLSLLVDSIETLKKHAQWNAEAGGEAIPSEMMGVQIGDWRLITSAAEIATPIALALKARSPHPHTYIAAFTNGYVHYGSPAADYSRGHYEVTECLLAPEWEANFNQKADKLLAQLE